MSCKFHFPNSDRIIWLLQITHVLQYWKLCLLLLSAHYCFKKVAFSLRNLPDLISGLNFAFIRKHIKKENKARFLHLQLRIQGNI